ncbi:hypothetical protein H8356DRAFT_1740844 [Neocallimastix lanati (nom. inval.)]|jgi:hypothetical protein|uniref:Uncharacterized protein n=1 Tax=Neocallimastix californiae TaxID=1754190 RepID=A0A1Y2CHW4_9FUNG|nr:hypothetical protein H8356DRAFT_1740768 [Neocallimastix sp. JGI-2020a]KAG4085347.1 hypothetical protein H8356DRAFT_1740844 [Neocallimastix sp. JGI-2020a]ORY46640.1 hypothetical protein LY90DRAFT_703344 [Neocallimastix californiae]ORY46641.1 hypothetical protein LY90DRAFT_703347 [Neocallimastix californiae]|eukprot:ORY46640.1 hypothetical protein LY90DRAFT_703344 [Neocallimastix californiae]
MSEEVPAIVKKYFPNGRPESWKKLFPNGPPPADLFEGAEPGKIPPKIQALFPDGLPDDLKVFKNGVPDDFREFLEQRVKELQAQQK